ncbi:MAG: VWA domain-containing protein [Phycisphaerae bacterium]|nr:VWA domain-containing protein [Phycisphaerae bacterium]
MKFESYEWLLGLWALPVLGAVVVYSVMRRRTLARRFISARLLPAMGLGGSALRRALRGVLLVLSVGFVVLGLARPQWGRIESDVKRQGRDLCFLIDVSKSMLAEDLAPNRLERAKIWVQDVLTAARGDRIALVAFAGEAVVKCPLTHDYGFAATALRDLSTESVSRGGTLIGDGIRRCVDEVFEKDDPSFKDIILITDGEDHESFPVDAAKKAGEAGVRIIAVGIGDESSGRPIQVTDPRTGQKTEVKYRGETVMSRLDAKTLREVASASKDGVYFNVATGTIDLDQVYKRLVRAAEQKDLETSRQERLDERFQVFLAAALVLLAAGFLVRERVGRGLNG